MLSATQPEARRPWRSALVLFAACALIAAYLFAGHIATTTSPSWAPFLSLAPLVLMLASIASNRAGLRTGVVVAVALATLTVLFRHELHTQVDWLYFIQHLGYNLALMLLFGLSLRVGHQPLITRMARLMRGADMPPAVCRYTRGATVAWTLFFGVVSMVSVSLFCWGDLHVWSVFANLLTAPLVGLMFIVEYAARRLLLRNIEHHSVLGNFRAAREAWSRQGSLDASWINSRR